MYNMFKFRASRGCLSLSSGGPQLVVDGGRVRITPHSNEHRVRGWDAITT